MSARTTEKKYIGSRAASRLERLGRNPNPPASNGVSMPGFKFAQQQSHVRVDSTGRANSTRVFFRIANGRYFVERESGELRTPSQRKCSPAEFANLNGIPDAPRHGPLIARKRRPRLRVRAHAKSTVRPASPERSKPERRTEEVTKN